MHYLHRKIVQVNTGTIYVLIG